MGLSYMRFVVDRNVVMRRIPVNCPRYIKYHAVKNYG